MKISPIHFGAMYKNIKRTETDEGTECNKLTIHKYDNKNDIETFLEIQGNFNMVGIKPLKDEEPKGWHKINLI